jgi:uncharacterized BrkB/YihY/UPF0761 family membrane protein
MSNQSELENEVIERPTRNIFLRILFGGLWFVGLYFIFCMLIGTISAIFADTSKYKSHAETSAAASQSGEDFVNQYGLIVFVVYVLLFIVLCFFRLLPGVSKYKKLRGQ